MKSAFSLPSERLKQNTLTLADYLKRKGLDGMYLSSYDVFINEYVPLEDCHRYYFTGFTGSVAEALALPSGKVHLFVDGRYHQQADLQCDPSTVVVEKCPYGQGLAEALLEKIEELGLKKLAYQSARTPLKLMGELEKRVRLTDVDASELGAFIDFKRPACLGALHSLPEEICGPSPQEKVRAILRPGEAFFLSALDSIAWITNCRGYQLPYQSTFRAKALAHAQGITLFIEDDCLVDEHHLSHRDFIKLVRGPFKNMPETLALEAQALGGAKVYYDPEKATAFDHEALCKAFGPGGLEARPKGILPFHSRKHPVEIREMQDSFAQADKAIWKTLCWVKEQVRSGAPLSELGYYQQANKFYFEGGCRAQSFHTIAAVGANSSIIHFSTPSDSVPLGPGQLVLLDSGAYYRSGLATDCTRTFLSGGQACDEQKKIYTLVLKGLLQAQNAVFPPGTPGAFIDGVARMPILRAGYNYAHGTGHGVGINVHEGEYSITPASRVPLYEGLVGSLEPGIYLPGLGGVRLENVVMVEKHPSYPQFLRFKSLCYVGFDNELIDFSLLNEEERRWLAEYEAECARRSTGPRSLQLEAVL